MKSLIFVLIFSLFLLPVCLLFGQKQVYSTKQVLMFSATWCGPCQQMKNNVWNDRTVQDTLVKNNYKYFYIDVDVYKRITKNYKIRAYPTIVIIEYVDGKWLEKDRITGGMNSTNLKKWLINNK